MVRTVDIEICRRLLNGLCIGASLMWTLAATAQGDSYAVGEDGKTAPEVKIGVGDGITNEGPVRLARFSYVHGDVTWRGDDAGAWSSAA